MGISTLTSVGETGGSGESPNPFACGVHLAGDTEGKKERRSIIGGVLEYEREGEIKPGRRVL